MAFRNPVRYAVDQVARDTAAAAGTAAAAAQTSATAAAQQAATALITAGTAQSSADAASSAAGNALAVASSRNHVIVSDTAPTTSTVALAVDDVWVEPIDPADATKGKRLHTWDGSAWQLVTFGTSALAAQAITADLIAAGAIGAGQIAAGAIDGKTITGALIRTAAAGQRVELSSAAGLVGYDAAGDPVTQIDPATGQLIATNATVTGVLQTAAAGPRVVMHNQTTTSGGVTTATAAQDFYALFSRIPAETPAGPLYVASNVSGKTVGDFQVRGGQLQTAGALLELTEQTSDAGVTWSTLARLTADHVIVSKPAAPPAGEDFALITDASPWGTYPGYMGLQVRKDASGVVHCWGLLRNNGTTTVSSGNLATGIPARMRPTTAQVPSLAYSSSGGVCRVDVTSGGAVILAVGSVAASAYLVVSFSWPGPDLAVA